MCIYTVKSVIKYYTRQNSPVYTCFLDASKALDRISHWTLFKKLIACSTPVLIVRILLEHLDLSVDYVKVVTKLYKPLKMHGLLEYSYGILGLKGCILIDDTFDGNMLL